jgi:hypothetical protein
MAGPRAFPRLERWLAEEERASERLASALGITVEQLEDIRAGLHALGPRLAQLIVDMTGDPDVLTHRPEVARLLAGAPPLTDDEHRTAVDALLAS